MLVHSIGITPSTTQMASQARSNSEKDSTISNSLCNESYIQSFVVDTQKRMDMWSPQSRQSINSANQFGTILKFDESDEKISNNSDGGHININDISSEGIHTGIRRNMGFDNIGKIDNGIKKQATSGIRKKVKIGIKNQTAKVINNDDNTNEVLGSDILSQGITIDDTNEAPQEVVYDYTINDYVIKDLKPLTPALESRNQQITDALSFSNVYRKHHTPQSSKKEPQCKVPALTTIMENIDKIDKRIALLRLDDKDDEKDSQKEKSILTVLYEVDNTQYSNKEQVNEAYATIEKAAILLAHILNNHVPLGLTTVLAISPFINNTKQLVNAQYKTAEAQLVKLIKKGKLKGLTDVTAKGIISDDTKVKEFAIAAILFVVFGYDFVQPKHLRGEVKDMFRDTNICNKKSNTREIVFTVNENIFGISLKTVERVYNHQDKFTDEHKNTDGSDWYNDYKYLEIYAPKIRKNILETFEKIFETIPADTLEILAATQLGDYGTSLANSIEDNDTYVTKQAKNDNDKNDNKSKSPSPTVSIHSDSVELSATIQVEQRVTSNGKNDTTDDDTDTSMGNKVNEDTTKDQPRGLLGTFTRLLTPATYIGRNNANTTK